MVEIKRESRVKRVSLEKDHIKKIALERYERIKREYEELIGVEGDDKEET